MQDSWKHWFRVSSPITSERMDCFEVGAWEGRAREMGGCHEQTWEQFMNWLMLVFVALRHRRRRSNCVLDDVTSQICWNSDGSNIYMPEIFCPCSEKDNIPNTLFTWLMKVLLLFPFICGCEYFQPCKLLSTWFVLWTRRQEAVCRKNCRKNPSWDTYSERTVYLSKDCS